MINVIKKQLFIKNYIGLLDHQYSQNRQLLKMVLETHNITMKDYWEYRHNVEYVDEAPLKQFEKYSKINKLIKEQIYIKQMINIGRDMQRDYIKNDLL